MFQHLQPPTSLIFLQNSVTASNSTVLALLFALLWFIRKLLYINHGPLSHIPSAPDAHWFWGHEKTVFLSNTGQAYTEWFKKLGHVFKIQAAVHGREILVISDPAAIAHLMQKRIYNYHHSELVRPRIERLIGRGLAWIEGEAEHRRMRRLIGPALSLERICTMSEEILDAANKVQHALLREVQRADGKTTLNIIEWTSKATLDIIGRVGFGYDFCGGTSEDAQSILEGWRNQAKLGISHRGFMAVMFLRRFPFISRLPLKALQSQLVIKQTIHNGVAREMIRRNQGVLDDSLRSHQDVLSRLMIFHSRGEISEQDLFDHICTLIVAGHETTAQTLALTIWELARHPESQQRLRAELNSFPEELTYNDYQTKLPYLNAVCREGLRLHPVLPYMERVATKPDILPLRHPMFVAGKKVDKVTVMPGQTVIIPIISVNRLNSVWGDGEVFRPERWLEPLPSHDLLCSGWGNTLAFSDGPRSCLGTRLALIEYKIILSTLIRRFSFKDTGSVIRFSSAPNVQPWVEGQRDVGPQLPVEVELA